jgi:hypothetical protein
MVSMGANTVFAVDVATVRLIALYPWDFVVIIFYRLMIRPLETSETLFLGGGYSLIDGTLSPQHGISRRLRKYRVGLHSKISISDRLLRKSIV